MFISEVSPPPARERTRAARANAQDWAKATTLESLATISFVRTTLLGDPHAEDVMCAAVSARFFDVLSAPAALGRPLRPTDYESVAAAPNVSAPTSRRLQPRTIVLGNGLWRRRFSSSPNVVGQRLDVRQYGSIEVSASWQAIFESLSLTKPSAGLPDSRTSEPRSSRYLMVTGKLKAGVTRVQAESEINVIARQLAAAYPSSNADLRSIALVSHSLMSAFVFGVHTRHATAFGWASIAVVIAGVSAAITPVLRAARVDPVRSLRHE